MMKLTERELVACIKFSDHANPVELHYGPGWVALADTPGNEWARRAILKARERKAEKKEA